MGDAKTKGGEPAAGEAKKEKKLLRVDQIFSRNDRQWRYVKTAKVKGEDARFRKYSIVVRRIISSKGLVAEERVDIKSSKLADLLKALLKDAGQLELSKNPPEVSPQQLFHAWPGVTAKLDEEKAKDEPDQEFISDLATALEFLEADFGKTVSHMSSLLSHGEITFDLLWALFVPGARVYTEDNTLREPQAVSFSHGEYKSSRDEGAWFELTTKMLFHDGDIFGWGWPEIRIMEFVGAKNITSLEVYPLNYHPDKEQVRAELISRGHRYVELVHEPSCLEYHGLGVYVETQMNGDDMEKLFSATGRIMQDPPTFWGQKPNHKLLLRPPVMREWKVSKPETLTDDEVMLSCHRINGFAFTPKTWGAFAVSRMKPVVWNEKAFEKLILEERKKQMIRLLVQSHRTEDTAFDDIVAGKGKGLVGLLSGPPGVGKTLTAEVVAELSSRPLYVVSAGELGITVDKVDRQLGMVLDITRRWGCVLLIDEADVFLYKRGEAQLERNALVSVFLRRLEYFQGIVILTTNRRRDIDEAFKSRIHFKFHYPALDEKDRRKIWRDMLSSVASRVEGLDLETVDLDKLAQVSMNGREIKNAVSCATSVVRASKEPLTVELITGLLESLVDGADSEED